MSFEHIRTFYSPIGVHLWIILSFRFSRTILLKIEEGMVLKHFFKSHFGQSHMKIPILVLRHRGSDEEEKNFAKLDRV